MDGWPWTNDPKFIAIMHLAVFLHCVLAQDISKPHSNSRKLIKPQNALSLSPYLSYYVLCDSYWIVPGLSDQRPSLIVAHGLLFGSFLPNRSPWASIWRKHCYDILERNCQIKAHGPVFRKPWYWRYVAKWSIKNYCWQDNCNSSC